jgi:hypothetical protein
MIQMSEDDASPKVHDVVTEILAINHAAAGEYVVIVNVRVLDDGAITYDWRWFWSPAVPVHEGEIL